jgi:hypothetical protein
VWGVGKKRNPPKGGGCGYFAARRVQSYGVGSDGAGAV